MPFRVRKRDRKEPQMLDFPRRFRKRVEIGPLRGKTPLRMPRRVRKEVQIGPCRG